MTDEADRDVWIAEHEWLVHELLHETRKLATCRGKVDGATQRAYDMALQALLAHAQGVAPSQLMVAGRGGVGTIPYILYATSRAEVHALRRAAESKSTTPQLTRADTKALWHAVQAQREVFLLRQKEGFTLADLATECADLVAARAALAKINTIRKVQAEERTASRGRGERECP
ncbi:MULTISPECIES: hypothetical protein [unclassified Acidovorax]|uniref:hypothetical protein n=1 Tax=unclassified Acidovorax TaxID=2684926 RepID=UPI0028831E88|nr:MULTISPECIES: hypothetical protein [unclassified Acidovorax]